MKIWRDNRYPLYLFRGFSRLYFHLPILLPVAFSAANKNMVQTGLVVAAYSIAVALTSLLKIPQKTAKALRPIDQVTLSECGKAAALSAIGASQNIVTLIISQIVIGICFAVGAGADAGLPFRYLTNEHRKMAIRSLQATMFAAVIVAAACSGFLLIWNNSAPFYCAAIAALIGAIFLRSLKEIAPNDVEKKSSEDEHESSLVKRQVRWWKAYYLVTRVSSMSVYVLLVPAACMAFGLPLQYFGLILSGFGIGGMVAAQYGSKVAEKIGYTKIAIASVMSTAAAIFMGIGGALTPILLFVTVTLIGLSGGMVRPCTVGGLGMIGVDSKNQGAIAASLEQLGGLLTAPAVMALAVSLGYEVSSRMLFLICGTIVGILGIVLLLIKVRRRND